MRFAASNVPVSLRPAGNGAPSFEVRVTAAPGGRGYASPTLGIEVDDDINDLLSVRLNIECVFVLDVARDAPAAAGLRGAKLERGGTVVPGEIIVPVDEKRGSGRLIGSVPAQNGAF